MNLANSQEIRILELVQRIKKLTGFTSLTTFHPLPEDDPRRRCPDISLAKRLLGWKPKISFTEKDVHMITVQKIEGTSFVKELT